MPEITLTMTPALHKRLCDVEEALPPEGMSKSEVVRRCIRLYRTQAARGPVTVSKFPESVTGEKRARSTVNIPEDLLQALPDGLRVIDVVAWHLAELPKSPPHPRRTMKPPAMAQTGETI